MSHPSSTNFRWPQLWLFVGQWLVLGAAGTLTGAHTRLVGPFPPVEAGEAAIMVSALQTVLWWFAVMMVGLVVADARRLTRRRDRLIQISKTWLHSIAGFFLTLFVWLPLAVMSPLLTPNSPLASALAAILVGVVLFAYELRRIITHKPEEGV